MILTHLSRMEFPTVINLNSPFPFKGLLGGILHFNHLNRTFCKQTILPKIFFFLSIELNLKI